jgi:BirA family transcriptional regulator, biotin operon repressor / biotin---[acetyl-CoA-carboxylase] ligase
VQPADFNVALSKQATVGFDASWQSLALELPRLTLEVVAEVDSTNSELMRRARAKTLTPTLLVAQKQTAGRGRLGRSWQSDADFDRALTFSLGVPFAGTDLAGFSLAVGVCVAKCLHPALGLKWPNDIWLQDRKLAGVLIETAVIGQVRTVVIGIGVNLAQPQDLALAVPSAGLHELLPQINAPSALKRLATPLLRTVEHFSAQGFAAYQAEFERLDVLAGRVVTLGDGREGRAHGVNPRGALLVHTSEGEQVIESSQLSVRPVL